MTPDGYRVHDDERRTSKGAYFLADDLPTTLESATGSCCASWGPPDPRQIDGIGGPIR